MSRRGGYSKKLSKYGIFAGRLVIALEVMLLTALLFQGKNFRLLDPKGFIAGEQTRLMLFSAAVLLGVAVPTVALLYFTAWKYRETNKKATYNPGASNGKLLVFSIWAIPSITMLILGVVMWPATHRLEHKEPIVSANKPITIQVVAMRWKWVFIYPEQDIATVNFVQVPTDTPIHFQLTADETPMSSFWIPHLGGQLYAMTGHMNQINLMAAKTGDYPGSSAEINGAGFAGMKFVTRASSKEDFAAWVQTMKTSNQVLDATVYKELLKPSEAHPVVLYSSAQNDLFDNLLLKYNGSHQHEPTKHEAEH